MLFITEVNIIIKLFIGNLLYSLGRKEEAIKDYTIAIDINPQKDEAFYNRG